MVILALEASTSSAKAMIYDAAESHILSVITRPYPSDICNTATMDIDGVINEVFSLGREILAGRTDIEMVVLSSIWYHSGGLFDKDLSPIGRLHTWASPAGSEIAREYREVPELYEEMYSLTGNPPHIIYALYKWISLAAQNGMKISDVPYLMALPDYLFMRFTGKRMVSASAASASGLMNIRDLSWDKSIMSRCGISERQLSVIREPEHTEPLTAEAAQKLGLSAGIPVLITGADGACNQIAVGGLNPGILSVSVGTSGALRLSTAEPLLSTGLKKNWCYYGAEQRWISGAATNGAGSCLDWFSKKICGGKKLSQLDTEITSSDLDFSSAPIFLPFQFGERCPEWRDDRKGGWHDLKGAHDHRHLYYSVLEGVLFNMYQCYLTLCPNEEPEHILLSGGIVRSEIWLKMAADIFRHPIELTSVEHASILGALYIARKVLGFTSDLKQISASPTRIIYPSESSRYAERFERYCKWYEETH